MREVDLSLVTYAPDFALLQRLLDSLAEPTAAPLARNLFIHDNSADASLTERIAALAQVHAATFGRIEVRASPRNVGFGCGHNANAALGAAPWMLVVNQDCVLEPGALEALVDAAHASEARVAACEMRQIPFEHPKAYHPGTLDTGWVSGAATLFRRSAFEGVGGFEPRIFMYGEDVDLSWRLRASGWRLSYQPRCAVVHRTYREAAEVKPLQVLGGVQTNLCLRARFGGLWKTLCGIGMLAAEIALPESFPGRRVGLVRAGCAFLARWPYFVRTRVPRTASFAPEFHGWGYELRRDGAFVEFVSRRERPGKPPLVSILIRTTARPAWLRQALESCARQTHPAIEVVVVEDGPASAQAVVAEFASRLAVRYHATHEKVGRSRAGNVALSMARGAWINFLDDDDLLFADHVEVLLDAAQRANVAAAYGLAWEVPTQVIDAAQGTLREGTPVARHRQRFDRLRLWHHNYLPIQSVLFHRRLYERHGGFAEDMEQLEDWNLWTRYALDDDFLMVEKTTSLYRVPLEARDAAARQARLDHAYAAALERQRTMRATFSPREIAEMAEAYARSQTVVMVTRGDLRRFVGAGRLRTRVAAYRPIGMRALRRIGWLK